MSRSKNKPPQTHDPGQAPVVQTPLQSVPVPVISDTHLAEPSGLPPFDLAITPSLKRAAPGLPSRRPEPKHYHGHRNRLRERFVIDNGKAMPDYELLEMLLALAQPRRDTKTLAKQLMTRFGSLGNILQAPDHKLEDIPGVGLSTVCAFRLVLEISQRSYRKSLKSKNVLSGWKELVEYCQKHMDHDDVERLHALFLNSTYNLIQDDIIHTGTVNHLAVFPREIFKAALRTGATFFILVHNHPSGDPNPSEADIKTTNQLKALSRHLGLVFLDHLIIGSDRRYVSLKNEGWL